MERTQMYIRVFGSISAPTMGFFFASTVTGR